MLCCTSNVFFATLLKKEGCMQGFLARATVLCLSLLAFILGMAPPARGADLVRDTLRNGLQVVIVRNTLAPVVTTQINYRVGSNEAPPGFPGMAHALEHMMFRGSPGLSAAQLSTIAAAMGGEFNADTQQTVTQYFFTVPAEDVEIALRIEATRMRGALNTQKLWELERGAIEQEVAQDLSNPQYVFYARLLQAMYAGTPYAHDALGTRESFRRTTGAMLWNFHWAWYAPNNAVLVVVGDIDPDRVLAMVKRLFGGISRRPLPPRPAVRLFPLSPSTITLDTDLPYGLAVVAYRLPGYESPDFAAGQVLADVLDSRRGNLYALVPEGKALFAGFDGSALPKAALGYATAAFPHGEDGHALAAAIKRVIADTVKNGIPESLVEAAKRHEIADAEFAKNSLAGLAMAWSQAIAVEGRTSPDDGIEAIKRVTVADVNRVAREYLVNDTAVVGVLTPRPSGAPVAAGGFRRTPESFALPQTKPVSLPSWATKVMAPPALPASTVSPIVTVLPSGLRLIVQPETISRAVSLYGRVETNPDLQVPAGKEGLAEVLEGLFPYGPTGLDRLAFEAAQDAIGARVSAGTRFSLQVLDDQFERGVELLAQNLLSPALPEGAFRVVRQETIGAVTGRLRTPSYLARRALRTALFPAGDPALRQATPESLASLSLDDVKAYYRGVFRPDMTTIVIIGRVTPEQARAAVEKHFGGWTARGPRPTTDLPPAPPNPADASVVPDASRVQDEVTLAQTVGVTRSHPDYYPLRLGNEVLSGAAFASRLFRDLRAQGGLVYSVDSLLDAGKHRSVFAVVYACDPAKVSKARALVERNLREMQDRPVPAAELGLAKTLLLRSIPLATASTERMATELLDLSARGLPLDEPVRAAKRYLEITATEVQAAFARWIRPGDLAQVTVGPNPG
jgi:zinc protease